MKGNEPAAGVNTEKMIALRDHKAGEIADLERRLLAAKSELIGYDKMLAAGGLLQPTPRSKPKIKRAAQIKEDGRKRRSKVHVKGIVMEIVAASGDTGITLQDVLLETEARGKPLPIDTVTRFLQRFNRDGHLTLKDGRYKVAA